MKMLWKNWQEMSIWKKVREQLTYFVISLIQLMGLTIVVFIKFYQWCSVLLGRTRRSIYTASADMLESEDGLGLTVVIYRTEEE